MILYHGSNPDIDTIRIKVGNHHNDSGEGFFLTPDINTAKRMAVPLIFVSPRQQRCAYAETRD